MTIQEITGIILLAYGCYLAYRITVMSKEEEM